MITNDFYFTLPDNIDLKKIQTKKIITKKIFLFVFFLFRWLIFEEYINTLKINFFFIYFNIYGNRLFFKQNQKFHLKFFYIFIYLIYLFKIYNLINITKLKLNFKDNNINVYLYLYKKSKHLSTYKFDYLYKYKKIKIFFFPEFKLRLPLFLFIGYKKYMQFFRFYKYNEYLAYHPLLYKYPLLKFILHKNWRGRKKRINAIYFSQQSNNAYFTIYYASFERYFKILKNFTLNWLTILLFLDKFKFLKFTLYLNTKIYIFVLKYFKIYFLNILYLFIYNFWLSYFLERHLDVFFAYKWRIFYMLHLHWWLNKYVEDLPSWLYMLLIIYLIKLFMSQHIYLYNFCTFVKLKDKNKYIWSFNNICLYKITNLIFNCYIDILYYKFYKLLLTRNYGSTRIFNLWEIYFRNYVFEFTDLSFFYNQPDFFFFKFFLNFKYSFDYIYWKIFFISNFINNKMLKFNILHLFKKLIIDGENKQYFSIFLEYLYSVFEITYNKKINFVNMYYMYVFVKNLIIKFLWNSKIFNKFLIYVFIKNNIKSNYVYFQWKLFLWNVASYFGYYNWNSFYLQNLKSFTWKYEAYLIYIIYLHYINYCLL